MQSEGLTVNEILKKLGDPKVLVRAYLGDLIANSQGFSLIRILRAFTFYTLVGFSGMIIIPILGIVSATFIFSGVITILVGIIRWIDYSLNLDLPYLEYVARGNDILDIIAHHYPILGFIMYVMVGGLLYLGGRYFFKLLRAYLKGIKNTKKDLSV